MSITDLSAEVSPRLALANWSHQGWIARLVAKSGRVHTRHRDYFDSIAVVLQHWAPDTDGDRARLRVHLRRGDLPEDCPPALIRVALARTSAYWRASAIDVLRDLFYVYQSEVVTRLNSDDGISPPDSIYLADLRSRLDGMFAIAEGLGGYRSVLVQALRPAVRHIDETFSLVLLPRLQGSIELAHNPRLLSDSVIDPGCWWGALAISAGEVVTHDAPPDPPDPSSKREDAEEKKRRVRVRHAAGYVKRRGRTVR